MEINLLHPQAFEKRQQLDWPLFMEKVKAFCHFDENHHYFDSPQLFKSTEKLERHFSLIENMTKYLLETKTDLFRSSYLKDLTKDELIRLKKKGGLNLKEINAISTLVENFESLIRSGFIDQLFDNDFQAPQRFKELLKLLKYVRRYVSDKGEIISDNDPVLKALIEKNFELENKVRQSLQKITSHPDWEDILQNKGIDVINDHYVVTIKSDRYQTNLGDIISHSQSGASLYLEPTSIRELSLKILLSKRELDKMIQRITFELSSKLFEYIDEIENIHKISLHIDRLQATAKLNLQYGFTKPMISDGEIELISFFHPLIDEPVRNHLILPQVTKGALISGPNTGGKTISLKVIGLSQLFMQTGFYVPADSAKLPLHDAIYFLGNDDQGVEQGLSSFSSEVKNYLEILNQDNDSALIIIDEVFNSTSSEEASALAFGFIQKFNQKSHNKVFISSHHSGLKNTVFENKTLESFHMGFKKPDNLPTYKLIQGSPGSSMALEVFEKLADQSAHKDFITEIASAQLESLHTHYEKLITELSQQKSSIENLEQKALDAQQDFEKQKDSYRHALKLESDREAEQIKTQLESIKAKFTRLQKTYSLTLGQNVSSNIKKLEADLKEPDQVFRGQDIKLIPVENDSIQVGGEYFSKSLGQVVNILKINGRQALANLGKIKLTVKLNDLYRSPNKGELKSPAKNQKVFIGIDTHSSYKTDYDCRGMRLDEFENEIAHALQGLMLNEVPYLRIIHGHGTGVLKNYLRTMLKNDSDFFFESCRDSADGATIIKLS